VTLKKRICDELNWLKIQL